MIRVHIFHTGMVIVDRSVPCKSRNPLAPLGVFRSPKDRVLLYVSSYLIEHPQARILLDTGWSSRYVTSRPTRFFGLLDRISTPVIRAGESADCRLAALGLAPSDLDYIVFSHMDFDHTSGLENLQGARHVIASEEEYADARRNPFRYDRSTWSFADIETFRFSQTGIGPVGKSCDLLGDGSILLVSTPGHSHGLVTTLVRSGFRYVALAGDTFYTQRNLLEHRIPGFTVDRRLAEYSLDYMYCLKDDPDCIGLFANHDPSVKAQIIEL
jgi:N-acyl homoserine lactone hydrolase